MQPTISFDEERIAELLATISHELRGPLASIKGSATTLLRQQAHLSPEEQRDFLQAIVAGSERLELLVRRFLTLAQVERGTLSLALTTFPLLPLLQEILAASERISPRHRFSLAFARPNVSLLTQQDVLIRADRQRLREVLGEVLDNAINYSPEGSLITVEGSFNANTAASQGQRRSAWTVEIQVRDQGVGIPAEQLSSIFERFSRVDYSLTRAVDGLGLGLALCQRIVTLHGGNIWAESVPAQGSIIHIVLPAEPPPDTKSDHEERWKTHACKENHDPGC